MMFIIPLFIILPLAVSSYASDTPDRVTQIVTVTVTKTAPAVTVQPSASLQCPGPISPPLASNSTPAYPAPPSNSTVAQPTPTASGTPNPFLPITPIPNACAIQNSCNHTLYVSPVHYTEQGPWEHIAAGTLWHQPLRTLPEGGSVMKISQNKSSDYIVQLEYGLTPETNGRVFYDLSLLGCLDERTPQGDASMCPGHGSGMQVMSGSECESFVCKPGEQCSTQAYFEDEFGYREGAPVGACEAVEGLIIEMCAGNRMG